MKKFLALVLALSMVLALCACGAPAEPNATQAPAAEKAEKAEKAEEAAAPAEKTHLKIMIWGSIEGRDANEINRMATDPAIADKYEIEYVLGGANPSECMEKFRLALASGENLCDIAVFNYAQVPELARAGALYDIGEAYAPYKDHISDAGLQLSQYDGVFVGAPSEIKTRIWFYRQDIFDECGVDASAVKTTDDFIAAGKKIQEKYPDSYMFNIGHNPNDYCFWLTLSGNGAQFFDEDGNYTIGTDAGVKAMLEDYKKMIDAGIVADISDWTPDWEAALADGTIVSCPSAAWLANDTFLPTYSADNAGKWAAAQYPSFGGATGGSDSGGQVWVVPTFSSNPEAAAEYVCWRCLGDASSNYSYEKSNTITAISNLNVINQDNIQSTNNEFFGLSLIKAQTEAGNHFGIFQYGPNSSIETTIALEYFTKAVYGEMPIDEAMAAAQKDMEGQIGNAYN